jgi:hypothetical protein
MAIAEREGFDIDPETPIKQGFSNGSAAKCAADQNPCPKLAVIASVWDHLPDDIREQILDIALGHVPSDIT